MATIKRPLFKYFGSKWKLAKRYPEPVSDIIFEPFAGGAAYSLHYHERQVILNELNPRIYGLWVWLIGAPSDIIANLPTFEDCEGLDLRQWASDQGLPWQAAELVIRWQRSGTNDCPTVSKWNSKPGQWDARTRDHVAESVQLIKHWKILNLDWRALPAFNCTMFCDPPYQSQRPQVYRNTESIDYQSLADYCLNPIWRQVIVCESSGADWLPFSEFAEVKTGRTGHNGAGKAGEVMFNWQL